MKYSVFWSAVAEARLAELWNAADDRQAVTDAANAIDRLLAHDPERLGESRPDETRIFFMPPLGVLFHVEEPDRAVHVLKVWRYKKRP